MSVQKNIKMNIHKESAKNDIELVDDYIFCVEDIEDGRCIYCGDPTNFISLGLEAFVCSGRCVKLQWNKYTKKILGKQNEPAQRKRKKNIQNL